MDNEAELPQANKEGATVKTVISPDLAHAAGIGLTQLLQAPLDRITTASVGLTLLGITADSKNLEIIKAIQTVQTNMSEVLRGLRQAETVTAVVAPSGPFFDFKYPAEPTDPVVPPGQVTMDSDITPEFLHPLRQGFITGINGLMSVYSLKPTSTDKHIKEQMEESVASLLEIATDLQTRVNPILEAGSITIKTDPEGNTTLTPIPRQTTGSSTPNS